MNNRLISAFLCVLLVEQLTGCKLHQPRFVADSEQTASSPTNTPEPSGPARVTTNPGDSNATPTVVFSVRLPISTVSPAESIRMLREMLAVKPNCDLPCFMSITPSQEIQQSSIDWILEQPYHNVTSKTASFAIVDEEQNKDFDYSFDVAVILENRIVDSIKIIAQSSGGRVASTHLPNDLKTFGWDDVLRKYGEPDSMQLVIEEIAAEKDTTLAYQFRLVYLDRGIAFEYTGPITFEPKTKKSQACLDPLTQFRIEAFLMPSGNPDRFRQHLIAKYGEDFLTYDLQATIGITSNLLYKNLLAQPDKPLCFQNKGFPA